MCSGFYNCRVRTAQRSLKVLKGGKQPIRPGGCLSPWWCTTITMRAAWLNTAGLDAQRQQPSGFGRDSWGRHRLEPTFRKHLQHFKNENDEIIYTVALCESSNCVPVELWHIHKCYMFQHVPHTVCLQCAWLWTICGAQFAFLNGEVEIRRMYIKNFHDSRNVFNQ